MTVKQAEFLCFEGREALYGGAAGGGKSVALLASALQFIDEPGYNALILRRSFAQLDKADSIMSKSKVWLFNSGAKWNESKKLWTFPNGNRLEFGHMENENAIWNYHGGIWAFIGVDEATQFSEKMISFPRSRQRREQGSKLPMRWRGTANPGGIGHAHIKERYIRTKEGRDPSGPDRQFFSAKIDDNPNLDREEYVTQLRDSGLDPLTVAQMLKGDWDAVIGGRFKREWFRYYELRGEHISMPGPQWFKASSRQRWMTIDTAASVRASADFTVISTWCVSPNGELVCLDVQRFQREVPEIILAIKAAVYRWTPQFVAIEEVGAHSGKAIGQILRQSTDPAMSIMSLTPKGQDKLMRATPAINLAHDGRLWLPSRETVPGFPHEDVENELMIFTGEEDAHDDVVDTFGYAAGLLSSMQGSGSGGAVVSPMSSPLFAGSVGGSGLGGIGGRRTGAAPPTTVGIPGGASPAGAGARPAGAPGRSIFTGSNRPGIRPVQNPRS